MTVTRRPTLTDVHAAFDRVAPAIRRTPVVEADGLPGVGARLVLKLELMQHAGSFKARGALNSVLALGTSVAGVCAASGGNHAAGVAWAARRAGVTADVFVPSNATPAKITRVREYGAEVHLVEGFVKDALEECALFADRRGLPQIHPYDTFETVAGAGTLGLEIAAQVPDAAMVALACGGGGLFAGTATALDGQMSVQPVEPEACPALAEALTAGSPVEVTVGGVASDTLGAPRIGTIGYQVAVEQGVSAALVTDAEILAARRLLWSHLRVLAEPGACAALAAVVNGRVAVPSGETVVVVISGGNNESMPEPEAD